MIFKSDKIITPSKLKILMPLLLLSVYFQKLLAIEDTMNTTIISNLTDTTNKTFLQANKYKVREHEQDVSSICHYDNSNSLLANFLSYSDVYKLYPLPLGESLFENCAKDIEFFCFSDGVNYHYLSAKNKNILRSSSLDMISIGLNEEKLTELPNLTGTPLTPPFTGYSLFAHSCFQFNMERVCDNCYSLYKEYKGMHQEVFYQGNIEEDKHLTIVNSDGDKNIDDGSNDEDSGLGFRFKFIPYDIVYNLCKDDFEKFCYNDYINIKWLDANFVFKSPCFQRSVDKFNSKCITLFNDYMFHFEKRETFGEFCKRNPIAASILLSFITLGTIVIFLVWLKGCINIIYSNEDDGTTGLSFSTLTHDLYLATQRDRNFALELQPDGNTELRSYEAQLPPTELPPYEKVIEQINEGLPLQERITSENSRDEGTEYEAFKHSEMSPLTGDNLEGSRASACDEDVSGESSAIASIHMDINQDGSLNLHRFRRFLQIFRSGQVHIGNYNEIESTQEENFINCPREGG
jgi:hypothetical protein